MKNKIIYFIIGLILIIFNYQNRITTIDNTTLHLIEDVNNYDTEKLWPGFENKDYMKDIRYNSSKEFRYDKGNITFKTPDQPVVSIEALKDDNVPLIKAVPFEKFRDIADQTGSSSANVEAKYKSVIIHESFHCFQMEHGLSEVADISDNIDTEDPDYEKFVETCKKLNQDDTYKKLWEDEYRSLLYLYENNDASKYKEAKSKRFSYVKSNFPDEFDYFKELVSYKEFIEGSARFVEEKYMVDLLNDPYINYEDRIFYSIDTSLYSEGSLKAKILDKYYPQWKENIDFSRNNNFDKMFKKGNIL
ncbi:hypothetical protein [uncultured Anaerococcus sp.]|uniref:hypothetical protein n=1 Tax=uncultured Anaerococcus sp. TaxID=293428 RepID=UPI0025CEED50|nr:hypothetical protein [uncultured Anaerococcus sp.]